MLSDRSYMREVNPRSTPSVLAWFLGLLVAGFVVQNVFASWFASPAAIEYGALSGGGVRRGFAWTLLTYVFLHGSISHLLLNGLGIFFIGRELQREIGPERLLKLLVIGALGGALLWLGVNFNRPGNVIGASGVSMALLAVFAAMNPRRPITLLLFFVIPITIQPIWLVAVFGGVDLLGFLFQELPNNRSLYGSGVAHSAHLGGLAAGWLFYRFAVADRSASSAIEPPGWLRRKTSRPAPAFRVNVSTSRAPSDTASVPSPVSDSTAPAATAREALRAEVDRILDKITLHGIGSLTAEEKRVLDEARRHLNPR